jgi:hypothetical protein
VTEGRLYVSGGLSLLGLLAHMIRYWSFCASHNSTHSRTCSLLLLIAAFLLPVIPSHDMNGHINETAPPLVPIVQVQIVVWFVRTCEVWIPFVLHFCLVKCMAGCLFRGVVGTCNGSSLSFEGHERSLLYDIL